MTPFFAARRLDRARSHMAYCRILLPRVLDVPRVIYLDCDVLVFRDLSELFDFELSSRQNSRCRSAIRRLCRLAMTAGSWRMP